MLDTIFKFNWLLPLLETVHFGVYTENIIFSWFVLWWWSILSRFMEKLFTASYLTFEEQIVLFLDSRRNLRLHSFQLECYYYFWMHYFLLKFKPSKKAQEIFQEILCHFIKVSFSQLKVDLLTLSLGTAENINENNI